MLASHDGARGVKTREAEIIGSAAKELLRRSQRNPFAMQLLDHPHIKLHERRVQEPGYFPARRRHSVRQQPLERLKRRQNFARSNVAFATCFCTQQLQTDDLATDTVLERE